MFCLIVTVLAVLLIFRLCLSIFMATADELRREAREAERARREFQANPKTLEQRWRQGKQRWVKGWQERCPTLTWLLAVIFRYIRASLSRAAQTLDRGA